MIKLKNILLETNIFKEANPSSRKGIDKDDLYEYEEYIPTNASDAQRDFIKSFFEKPSRKFEEFKKAWYSTFSHGQEDMNAEMDAELKLIYDKNQKQGSLNDTFKDINVNYIQVDTNFQNMTLQKQGVLDEFFLEEVIGDIEAHIDDSNLTDDNGNSAFDITRLVSDLKFDCEIKIDNSEIDLTITFDANGDILDVDIDDESIAEKYGITTETIMSHLESKGI